MDGDEWSASSTRWVILNAPWIGWVGLTSDLDMVMKWEIPACADRWTWQWQGYLNIVHWSILNIHSYSLVYIHIVPSVPHVPKAVQSNYTWGEETELYIISVLKTFTCCRPYPTLPYQYRCFSVCVFIRASMIDFTAGCISQDAVRFQCRRKGVFSMSLKSSL